MATMTVVKCPCGTNFSARLADVNRGWGKYCCKAHKSKYAKSAPAPVCSNCNGTQQDPEIPFLDCEVCVKPSILSLRSIDDGGHAGPSFEQLDQHLCSDQACECAGTGVIDVPFKREERYVVVKLKDLVEVSSDIDPSTGKPEAEFALRSFLESWNIPTRACVVIEKHWPEFEPAYQMIEERMTGQTTALERETSERLRGDVAVADCNDAERREAALREDLSMFVKAQLGISISEPGESFVQTTLRLYRMSKRRAAEFGIPEGESLEADIEAFEDYDALQQRLTVAEQRYESLRSAARRYLDFRHAGDCGQGYQFSGIHPQTELKAALKPAEEGEGA